MSESLEDPRNQSFFNLKPRQFPPKGACLEHELAITHPVPARTIPTLFTAEVVDEELKITGPKRKRKEIKEKKEKKEKKVRQDEDFHSHVVSGYPCSIRGLRGRMKEERNQEDEGGDVLTAMYY